MWRAVLGVVLVGCGFTATNASSGEGASAPIDAAFDAPPGTPQAFCADPAQGHVIACFELENTADDGASHHLKAHASGLTFIPGKIGQAAAFTGGSMADYEDDAALDVTSITIEMWLNPTTLPGDTAYLLDVDGQYAFQLKKAGGLHCTLTNSQPLDAAPALATGVWHHVACTYDATTGTSVIYVNGSQSNSLHGDPNALATKGTTGLSLAANNPPGGGGDRQQLTGLLDQVRVLDYARTATDICADAGGANCQ